MLSAGTHGRRRRGSLTTRHVAVLLTLGSACTAGGERTMSHAPELRAERLTRSDALQADGVIGATCSAEPRCFDCDGKGNVCRMIKDRFYPGVLMTVAKQAVIKDCQSANALDECGNHCDDKTRKERIAQAGGGCYAQCEKVATCVYGDNR